MSDPHASQPRFGAVLAAIVIATALLAGAFLIHERRPAIERNEPTAALAKATGKCAECHRRETSAIVDQFERSKHAAKGVNCLDCHHPVDGQESMEHRGFTIAKSLTSKNCAQCHADEYAQFARSRHAGPSWTAVNGNTGMSDEQRALGERYHPGWINRSGNPVGPAEGQSAMANGCNTCHAVGKPNPDGSFGTCTNCHARHAASLELAREPSTCGQCHMGPDHSQIEIYEESKHGALFAAQHEHFNLAADPKKLTTADMSVPTCATCHMSGLEGMKMTHDTTERLSYFLFAPVSTKRPDGDRRQPEMKEVCLKCHTRPRIDAFYTAAEDVLRDTNSKVEAAQEVITSLRNDGLLTPTPFDENIEFTEFDLWHYYGRTAKHGAFMGGADFVQWHGNYELLRHKTMLDVEAAELRARTSDRAAGGATGHPKK